MELDLSKVRYSYWDKKKGIRIPNRLTEELAEDIGIHIGDGSLHYCNSAKSSTQIVLSSNVQELDYLDYVIALKKRLYNLNKFSIRENNNERDLVFHSIAIATFYNSVFNIPIGKKTYIGIPEIIKKSGNKKIIASCIRGIVDTDFYFCFNEYKGYFRPVLLGRFLSFNLVKDLSELFDFLGIENRVKFYHARPDKRFNKSWLSNVIRVYDYKKIGRFLKIVGFNNPKNIKKLELGPKKFEL